MVSSIDRCLITLDAEGNSNTIICSQINVGIRSNDFKEISIRSLEKTHILFPGNCVGFMLNKEEGPLSMCRRRIPKAYPYYVFLQVPEKLVKPDPLELKIGVKVGYEAVLDVGISYLGVCVASGPLRHHVDRVRLTCRVLDFRPNQVALHVFARFSPQKSRFLDQTLRVREFHQDYSLGICVTSYSVHLDTVREEHRGVVPTEFH